MILILKLSSNEIIGADKEFLNSYTIEELNKKFNSNIDAIKKEYSSDYKIERVPIKEYIFLIFYKKHNEIDEVNKFLIDDSLLNNDKNEKSLENDDNLAKKEKNEKKEQEESLTLDNLLGGDLLINEENSEEKEETINNKNELLIDDLLGDDILNNNVNSKEEKEKEKRLDLDNLLGDEPLLKNEDENSETIGELKNNSEEKKEENKLDLDNLLGDEPLLKNEDENSEAIGELKVDNFLADDSLLKNEDEKINEKQRDEIKIEKRDEKKEENKEILNLDELSSDEESQNSGKKVIEINFDIDSILKKKTKKG